LEKGLGGKRSTNCEGPYFQKHKKKKKNENHKPDPGGNPARRGRWGPERKKKRKFKLESCWPQKDGKPLK